MRKTRFALTCAATAALTFGAASVAFGNVAHSTDAPNPDAGQSSAANVPTGCKKIEPSSVTTDKDGATTYEFHIPDPAGTAVSDGERYDVLTQVVPPKNFDPSTASDAQLEKYQYPKSSYATAEARKKNFSRKYNRDIGAASCPSMATREGVPVSGPSDRTPHADAMYACQQSDDSLQTGYTGCESDGLLYAMTAYQAPTLSGDSYCNGTCSNSTWAALGGHGNPKSPFLQAGTINRQLNEGANQYMFIEYFSAGGGAGVPPLLDYLKVVNGNDPITAQVDYKSLGLGLGLFQYCVEDNAPGLPLLNQYCGSVALSDSQYDPLMTSDPQAATAEAITERVSGYNLEEWNKASGHALPFQTFKVSHDPSGAGASTPDSAHRFPVKLCYTIGSTSCPSPDAEIANVGAMDNSTGAFNATWCGTGAAADTRRCS